MNDMKAAMEEAGVKTIPQSVSDLMAYYAQVQNQLAPKGYKAGTSEVCKGVFGVQTGYDLRDGKYQNWTAAEIEAWNSRFKAKIDHLRKGGKPDDFRLKKRYTKGVVLTEEIHDQGITPEAAAKVLWDAHHGAVLLGLLKGLPVTKKRDLLTAIVEVYPDIGKKTVDESE